MARYALLSKLGKNLPILLEVWKENKGKSTFIVPFYRVNQPKNCFLFNLDVSSFRAIYKTRQIKVLVEENMWVGGFYFL